MDAPESLTALIDEVFLIERLREVRVFRGFTRIRPDANTVKPDLGRVPRDMRISAIVTGHIGIVTGASGIVTGEAHRGGLRGLQYRFSVH